ncbi:MAG: hypothetical protein NWQ54_15560 [Paraglaciecola sp.]|uniref:hypothetical protein n=1 Tax=Paraglaciecola sp. TaxID=1920173 RepID=UPI00273FCB99|nr:hypothetical protein [Paraglaciecola sp.]MDP5030748.1 hypothetical protein [Paraglaciecola sp.]MDP5132302.1 hypothetical protein [Paraglaciecola sp.]
MNNGKMMNKSVEIEIVAESKELYIFFGGIAAGIAMPPFEFYNAAKIINSNKIFIRDFTQSWYQNGLALISEDIDGTVRFIQLKINELKAEKIFFVGNSMGGFAAILFCNLLQTGQAIAFAPQTFISPLKRLIYRDSRWTLQILNTYKTSLFKSKIWDLKSFLLKINKIQPTSIYVCTNDKLDYLHAKNISQLPNITINEFNVGGHDIVKILRDAGLLPAIMSGNYKNIKLESSL